MPIKSISILPVDIVIDNDKSLGKNDLEQLDKGKEVLTSLIAEYFENFNEGKSITFISESKIEAMDIDFSRCPTYMSRARMVCQNIESDAALVFTLHRYVEREGTTYSVVKPASVHFEYKLLDTKTGRVLTTGRFDETQKHLLEDVFSLFKAAKQRGIKWITVKELAREGLHKKLQADSYLKKK